MDGVAAAKACVVVTVGVNVLRVRWQGLYKSMEVGFNRHTGASNAVGGNFTTAVLVVSRRLGQ